MTEKELDIKTVKKTLGRPVQGPVPDGYYYHRNYGQLPEGLQYLEYKEEDVPGYTYDENWQPTHKTRAVLISMSNVYNLGVRWIQSVAMHAGYDCHTVFFGRLLANDWSPPTKTDWDNLLKALKEIDPQVIGLSIACTSYWKQALAINIFLKEHFPNAVIIWGSIHVDVAPEQCFEHNNILCLGEGELPFLELLNRVEEGKPYNDIPNLWVRDADGTEHRNPMRPVIRDLDSIPAPIWDDKNKWYIRWDQLGKNEDPAFKEYYIFVMTNRGCPYHCNYCVNSVFNQESFRTSGHNRLRQRSVPHVIEEMKRMKGRYWNFDNLQISFFDDIFTLNPDWVLEFASEYKKNFKNPFWCYFHPNNIREDVMDALKDIGISHVDMGVQTGSERIRIELMKRPETNESIMKACKIMKDRNISYVLDVITDNAFETEQDMIDALEFFLSLPGPYSFNFYSLIWFPGVPLTQFALDAGYITRAQVEDEASKTLDQFVATFSYEDRKPRDKFYIPLFHMASRRVYSRNFILWLVKKRHLENKPWIFYKLVDLQNILDIGRKIMKIPQKMREGWTLKRFWARIKLYLLWERPYNK